jgi:hypothetical protein
VAIRAGADDHGWAQALGASTPARVGSTVDDVLASDVGVIVVPEAASLSAEEGATLRRFVEGGGGVVLGVRVAGAVAGFAPTVVRALPPDEWAAIAARAEGPLAAALPRGARLPAPGVPRVGVESTGSDLCWVPAIGDAGRCLLGAAAREEIGAGRVAWIAVAPGDAAVGGDEERALVDLARAALAWAARRPSLELRAPAIEGSAVGLTVADEPPARLLVQVANPGPVEARDVVLRVHLNAAQRSARAARVGAPDAELVAEPAGVSDAVDVRLAPLAPGTTQAITIEWTDGAAG